MTDQDNNQQDKMQIEISFKKEIMNKLNIKELASLPSSLDIHPVRVSGLDRWRKIK